MTARVLVIQHLPHEHSGVLGELLVRRAGVEPVDLRAWEGEAVPAEPSGWYGIAVLGGDMDTDQDAAYPFLAAERRLLAAAVDAGVPTLGLCLGAQLLAEATGGRVVHSEPEIGYVRLRRAAVDDPLLAALPAEAAMFNAHRDQIIAGPGATVLASTAVTPVAAFRVGPDRAGEPAVGRAGTAGAVGWGLQFHPEVDASAVAAYVEAPGVDGYLRAHGWTPQRLLHEARRRNREHRAAGAAVLDAWIDEVTRLSTERARFAAAR